MKKQEHIHQLIAVACSVDHAKTIKALYNERGYDAEVIYGQLTKEEKEEIVRKLRSGAIDCIVQVQMLGEGFDHPKLSVAAIFRPFRSLAPYIQFVGRILRVIVQNDPVHPDNYGHIVTHVGMNLDKRLEEFKLFEKDDQRFWDEVIGGADPEPPRSIKDDSDIRRNVSEPRFVNDEIVESLVEEDFTTADDEDLIRDLAQKLEALGLDPSDARDIFFKKTKGEEKVHQAAEPFPVLPQRQWQELKRRLDEKVKRSGNILLQRLDLKRVGRKLANYGVPAASNFAACIILINRELKKEYPKPRSEWSSDEFRTAMDSLDSIVNALEKQYAKLTKQDT